MMIWPQSVSSGTLLSGLSKKQLTKIYLNNMRKCWENFKIKMSRLYFTIIHCSSGKAKTLNILMRFSACLTNASNLSTNSPKSSVI